MTQKIWFITGCSRGFGREWAIAALERGDKVAATARDTTTLDDLVTKYGDAVLPLQLDVTDREADFAAVASRARALRPARRRGQQRRLRPVRVHRGAQRAGVPRPARDQRLRRDVGDPGGAPVPARAGVRPHPPGLVDRRHLGVPEHRRLPRLEVGARGLLAGARAGGGRVRHPRDADRAGRLRDRLGRRLGQARDPAAGVRRGASAGRRVAADPQQRRPGRPAGLGASRPRGGRRGRTRRCASSSG